MHYSMYYVLRVAGMAKIILVDFNLVVSTPIAKLSNLKPRQIFRLYDIQENIASSEEIKSATIYRSRLFQSNPFICPYGEFLFTRINPG